MYTKTYYGSGRKVSDLVVSLTASFAPHRRSNLLLTSMEGKTSGWQDSLLNPTNTKYAMEVCTYTYIRMFL